MAIVLQKLTVPVNAVALLKWMNAVNAAVTALMKVPATVMEMK
jgi:hypothetical protein